MSGITSKRPMFESTKPQHQFRHILFLSSDWDLKKNCQPEYFSNSEPDQENHSKWHFANPSKYQTCCFSLSKQISSKFQNSVKVFSQNYRPHQNCYITGVEFSSYCHFWRHNLFQRLIENGPSIAIHEKIKAKFCNYIVNYFLPLSSYPKNLVHFTALEVANWIQKISYLIRKRVNWPKPDVQNEKLKKERIQHETFTKCDQCQSVPLAKVQSALFYFHFLPHFCTNAVSA